MDSYSESESESDTDFDMDEDQCKLSGDVAKLSTDIDEAEEMDKQVHDCGIEGLDIEDLHDEKDLVDGNIQPAEYYRRNIERV